MSGDCKAIRRLLPLFVGDDLDADRATQVRRHLIDCAPCRGEAAQLQQACKALHTWGHSLADAIEPAFDDMHAAVVAATDRLADQAESSPWPWSRRLAVIAAAVLLAAFGFWLSGRPASATIWDRPALRSPTAAGDASASRASPASGLPRAVPHAGPRLGLSPVGLDNYGFGSAANGYGPGMMGRGMFRTLVEEEFVPVLCLPSDSDR